VTISHRSRAQARPTTFPPRAENHAPSDSSPPPLSLSQHVGRAAYLINAANGSERGYLRRNFGR